MVTFYRTMFERTDAVTAWKEMNRVTDPNKSTFSVFTADFNFRFIVHRYLAQLCSDRAVAERIARIEGEAVAQGIPVAVIERQRPRVEAHLLDFRGQVDSFKANYFFMDVFPENADRFSVTLEDCLRDPSSE